ncbi:hypothetical protein HNR51_004321 [Methylorubrum thiocyanatum]|uniref:HAMP domain-containing protein n=1 Tax=Methylorubrum thiocyanatum TaxID=47958 RepID=A0AA40S5Z6_9HYPH|nr:hypothetical protein [Methylorubrum thiocyanatum]GJE81931.1 hypothetical protein CJNNKLLH_3287 [Methylorubrum thiocyanatum]
MKRKFYLSHFDDGEKERIFPSTNYGAFAAITKTGWLYTSRHLDQIGWPAQTAESTWTSLSNNAPEAESIADAFAFGAQPGIVSQGDRAMGTDLARAQYGFDGSGITVGVISDSFDKYGAFASDRASGELPWDTRILREGEWGNDEGRAMAQIIHDVAPGASILFAAGGRTMADMAQAIRDLAAAGAKVIVDDLFYQAEPTYQDSIINNARAATRLARTMTGRAGFLIIEACAGDRVPSVAECSETREHEAQSDLAWTTVGRMISAGESGAALREADTRSNDLYFSGPIKRMRNEAVVAASKGRKMPMDHLAHGRLETAVPVVKRGDEIGAMARAVQVFKENMLHTKVLEEETVPARASAEEQCKAGMPQMADAFEAAVGGIVGPVSSAVTELQTTARPMTATAQETATQSVAVATAAEEAASNVGTVACAAKELGASVQEIGRQCMDRRPWRSVPWARRMGRRTSSKNSMTRSHGSATWSGCSRTSPARPTCWRSTRRSRRRGLGRRAAASRWWRPRSKSWPARPRGLRRRSLTRSARCKRRRAAPWRRSAALRARSVRSTRWRPRARRRWATGGGHAGDRAQRGAGLDRHGRGDGQNRRRGPRLGGCWVAATQMLGSSSALARQSGHLTAEVGHFLDTVRAA